jgi:hypothetical protein
MHEEAMTAEIVAIVFAFQAALSAQQNQTPQQNQPPKIVVDRRGLKHPDFLDRIHSIPIIGVWGDGLGRFQGTGFPQIDPNGEAFKALVKKHPDVAEEVKKLVKDTGGSACSEVNKEAYAECIQAEQAFYRSEAGLYAQRNASYQFELTSANSGRFARKRPYFSAALLAKSSTNEGKIPSNSVPIAEP